MIIPYLPCDSDRGFRSSPRPGVAGIRGLCAAALPLVAAVGFCVSSARAVPAVNFDGANTAYVTANTSLALPTAVTSTNGAANEVDYNYNPTTKISPNTGYTGPIFYGALWFSTSDSSQTAAANARLRSNYVNGTPTTFPTQIELPGANATAPATSVGANFVAFLQPSFAGVAATSTLAIDSTSSYNLTVSVGNGGTSSVRFAILNAGQWYLSSANTGSTLSTNTGGNLTLAGTVLLNSTWAAWNPNGGTAINGTTTGRLADVPTTFSTLGSSFTNIQGAGYYTTYTTASGSHYAYVPEFTTNFAVVPEPSTLALLGVGAAGGWLLVRRRVRAVVR